MTNPGGIIRRYWQAWLGAAGVAAGLAWLFLHQLGGLTGGLSQTEVAAADGPLGWHGLYHDPFFLPLKLLRSAVFVLFPQHGQFLIRLPNALLGVAAVLSLIWLIRIWHGTRIAVFTGVLFATGAFTLHASRLASNDIVYFWAMPTLMLVNALVYRYANRAAVMYGSWLALGLLLYVPGMVWLVALDLVLLRKQLKLAWQHFKPAWQRLAYGLFVLLTLPLLIRALLRSGQLAVWLGWPGHESLHTVIKHVATVPVHLFVHGPRQADLWLGMAPLLDVFTLGTCLIGVYFYIQHLGASRSRLLVAFALIGWALVGLAGPVSLSLLVPLLYVVAATGIAYLLHEWLRVFPLNPLARGLGVAFISLAVAVAGLYNLRAYFVAWPHNPTTKATFIYRR